MPRPEREEQMLAAATQLFTERGYANVSMDAIAEAAGITKPLIYSYFGSKEGLYAGCIRRFLAPLENAIGDVVDAEPAARAADAQRAPSRCSSSSARTPRSGSASSSSRRRTARRPRPRSTSCASTRSTSSVPSSARRCATRGCRRRLEPEIRYQVYIFAGGVESLARWWVDHPDEATAEQLALRVLNQAWLGFGDLLEGKLLTLSP